MRVTQLLLSSVAAAIMATAAFGAQAQTAPSGGGSDAFNWTGPYIGVNAGYDYDGATRFDRTTGSMANNTEALTLGLRPESHDIHNTGFTGGGQIGYNIQLGDRFGFSGPGGGGLVVGAEADAAYTDIHGTNTLSNTSLYGPLDVLGTTPTTRVNQYEGGLDFLGTVRGRLGFAFDRTLIYGTGGLAYGQVDSRTTFYGPNAPTTPYFTGTENGMRTGYAYGGGIEYAVAPHSFFDRFNYFHASSVTLKAEYIHYDLGSQTLNFPGVNGGSTIGGYTSRVRTDGDLVRAGLNYKF